MNCIYWSTLFLIVSEVISAPSSSDPSMSVLYLDEEDYEYESSSTARASPVPSGFPGIPGTPDISFPVYSHIPPTNFTCSEEGYFSDVEARCQVFHVCISNVNGLSNKFRMHSFLCPIGTIFSQDKILCDWWYNNSCSDH